MKKKIYINVIFAFTVLSTLEFCFFRYLNMTNEAIVENLIQCMILNVAALAFYTWNEDNKLSNIELVFEFDKRWDEIIKIIDEEFNIIKKEISDKKAEIEDNEYLAKLELLKEAQIKLKFLLDKISYYEGNIFGNKTKIKSYIDFDYAIKSIKEATELIFEINKSNIEVSKARRVLLELYKHNLHGIKKYVNEIFVYKKDYNKINDIDMIIADIESYINENDKNENYEERSGNEEKNDNNKYKNPIGNSIGNNRYFISIDNANLMFTSRNWNESNNDIYETWYTIPKEGKRSLEEGKGYYFIVREMNEKNEFSYLYLSSDNIKKLVEEKNITNNNSETDDNYIHFYFRWNKYDNGSMVTDTRNNIKLKENTYELGKLKLKGKQLFK